MTGNDTSCSFQYLVNDTAIITSYNMTKTGGVTVVPTYYLTISGNKFLLSGNSSSVIVSVAGIQCDIITLRDDFINCSLSDIPWGNYYPQVLISSYGYAVRNYNKTLTFDQVCSFLIESYLSHTIQGYKSPKDNL